MASRWTEEQRDVAAEQATHQEIGAPHLYRVLLHNDNYTTMEFVVMVLIDVFHKPESEALVIMLDVHHKGTGVVGAYPREIAETKVQRVTRLAREAEFPLLCTMEPE